MPVPSDHHQLRRGVDDAPVHRNPPAAPRDAGDELGEDVVGAVHPPGKVVDPAHVVEPDPLDAEKRRVDRRFVEPEQ